MKKIILSFFAMILATAGFSQTQCQIELSGEVLVREGNSPSTVPYAYVDLLANDALAQTDSAGQFSLPSVCPGNINLEVSSIGYTPKTIKLNLKRDTFITIYLTSSNTQLEDILIQSSEKNKPKVNENTILQDAGKSFSEIASSLPGVTRIESGSGLSVPIIQGMNTNRVAIVNNNTLLSGQQWGNAHSPEIDPLSAGNISIISGVKTLEYSGNSLGAILRVNPPRITNEEFRTSLFSQYSLNGNAFHNYLRMNQKHKNSAWLVQFGFKKSGDRFTPDYYLTNTGSEEKDISSFFSHDWSKSFTTEISYQFYDREQGILRGSQIGNLTDLEIALSREVPFFTKDNFSYDILAPRQEVQHHLLNVKNRYMRSENSYFTLDYSLQFNDRKEYDVRRGDRSTIPALAMRKFSHDLKFTYENESESGLYIKTGAIFRYLDNTNSNDTGILPLIPNYESVRPSLFALLEKKANNFRYEAGLRYNYIYNDVTYISNTVPRKILNAKHHYHTFGVSGSLKYSKGNNASSLDLSFISRAPEVNELYIQGLHQGVSGIEEGDTSLTTEHSLKLELNIKQKVFSFLTMEFYPYINYINDFIFLSPSDEIRLTIRGSFPVFEFIQTNALIYGGEVRFNWLHSDRLVNTSSFSTTRGQDLKRDEFLVYIPADNISHLIEYSFKSEKEYTIGAEASYTWKQFRVDEEKDFAPPPPAYFLLGAHASMKLNLGNKPLTIRLKVENLLNNSYRNYLNKLRYYADEQGINVSLSAQLVL